MVIGVFIVAGLIIFGSVAAIQMFVSPTELHDMGVGIVHRQF